MSSIVNPSSTGGGSGTVTSISQGPGIQLTPNPITTTGSVALDINSLTAETSVASGDLFPFLDVSVGTTPADQRKATLQSVFNGLALLGQALTKVDDTNVTLTLGGSPATALLNAASITVGWTGQLSIARGGTGQATALAAFNALSPLTTRGDLLTRDATNNVRLGIGAAARILQSDGTDPSWVAVSADATIAVGGALTLATVNANVGSFGDATHVGAFTVNAKGLITAASSVLITGTSPGGAAGGDLSGTYPNPTVIAINGVAYNADPLVQYLKLAGRTGTTNNPIISTTVDGSIAGSSAANKNLILNSSTNAAWGEVLFNQIVTTVGAGQAVSFASVEANGLSITGAAPTVLGITIGGDIAVPHAVWTYSGSGGNIFGLDVTMHLVSDASSTRTLPLFEGYRFDPELVVGSGSTFTMQEVSVVSAVPALSRAAATGTLTVNAFNMVKAALAVNAGSTVGTLRGVYMSGSSGAGAVNNIRGLQVDDQPATTSVYAVNSLLTAGSGKRCIQSTGDAASTHAGTFRIGDNTVATEKLEVAGSAVVTTSLAVGRTTIGTAALTVVGDADISHDGAAAFITLTSSSNNAQSSAILLLQRSRGSIAVPSAVSNNDELSSINTFGHDGSLYTAAAAIEVDASETWDGTHHAARLLFLTRASADVAVTERMRIGSTGNVGIGGTSLTALFNVGSSDQFQVSSTGAVTAKGAAHNFGTAGTACTLQVGQGTTGADNATLIIDAGNGGGVPALKLQTNAVDAFIIQVGALGIVQHGNASGIYQFYNDATFTANGFTINNGKNLRYNNIATVSNGVPAEYATIDLTAQGGAIGSTLLYAVPAAGAGTYRISYVATVTRAATTSSVLGGTGLGFQIDWTDADTSVAKLSPAGAAVAAGTNTTLATPTNAANTTAASISGCIIVRAAASTNINYRIGYTSVGGTTMQFNLHVKLEAL